MKITIDDDETTRFECDHGARRVTIVRRGILDLETLVGHIARMRELDIWSYSVLVDAQRVPTSLCPEQTQEWIRRVHALGDPVRLGPIAVVASDDLTFGMVRMIAGLSDSMGIRMRVFRQIANAESWLISSAPPRH